MSYGEKDSDTGRTTNDFPAVQISYYPNIGQSYLFTVVSGTAIKIVRSTQSRSPIQISGLKKWLVINSETKKSGGSLKRRIGL